MHTNSLWQIIFDVLLSSLSSLVWDRVLELYRHCGHGHGEVTH